MSEQRDVDVKLSADTARFADAMGAASAGSGALFRRLAINGIHGAQISLRFDVPPTVIARYLRLAIATLGLDFFLCTEGKGRAKAVRKALGKEWRVVARGEYLIGTRRAKLARWRLWPSRYRIVKNADWTNGPHAGTRHFAVLFSNYRIKATGQRLRLMVLHATSGVQWGSKWGRATLRVRAYRLGVHTVGEWIGRAPHSVLQVIGLDSNLEQHLAEWRDYLEHELSLRSMWHDARPTSGTHAGGRLIDTMHSNMAVTEQDVEQLDGKPKQVDHDIAHGVFHPDRRAA